MKGLARVIAVAGNFAATEKLILKSDSFQLKVVARAPQGHCYELSVLLRWISENALISTVVGGLVVTLVGYVCKKAAGDREEMRHLKAALDNAIRELGHRDQTVIDRLLGTIDRMADSLRPSVRQSVSALGETATKMTISDAGMRHSVSLGEAEKSAILAESPVEVGKEDAYTVKFTEMDMDTGSCKLEIEGQDDKRISGKVTDPEFILASNAYVSAMARKEFIRVLAKPTLKDGDIDRLFISNLASD